MSMTIKEAKLQTSKGKQIPINKIRDGHVIDVSGIITKAGKKNFVKVEVIFEKGKFYLKNNQKVQLAFIS